MVQADEQYVVPTDGAPIRGLIQDHVAGGVLLTKRDTFLTCALMAECNSDKLDGSAYSRAYSGFRVLGYQVPARKTSREKLYAGRLIAAMGLLLL